MAKFNKPCDNFQHLDYSTCCGNCLWTIESHCGTAEHVSSNFHNNVLPCSNTQYCIKITNMWKQEEIKTEYLTKAEVWMRVAASVANRLYQTHQDAITAADIIADAWEERFIKKDSD